MDQDDFYIAHCVWVLTHHYENITKPYVTLYGSLVAVERAIIKLLTPTFDEEGLERFKMFLEQNGISAAVAMWKRYHLDRGRVAHLDWYWQVVEDVREPDAP